MASLLELAAAYPTRSLAEGEILVSQGEGGGDLFILERGKLTIERDGVPLATLSIPGTVVGELSVLTGIHYSATVRAETDARVRAIRDAMKVLETEPALTLRLASLVAARLEATSGELVALSREQSLKAGQNVFSRLAAALHGPRD